MTTPVALNLLGDAQAAQFCETLDLANILGDMALGCFDYYVNSVTGSDTNNGSTPSSAFATIAAVNAVMANNLKIGLAKGSYWRERLLLDKNDLVVKAYGTGAAPLLDGADIIPNANFSKTGGYTNVYEVTLTVQGSALPAEYPSLWIDGARVAKVASLAVLDATPGAIYYGTVADLTSIVLYVHSTSSSDPTSDGKVYEAPVRNGCLQNYDGLRAYIEGINSQRSYTSYGSLTIGKYGVAKDCIAYDGNTHNVYLREFAQAINVTAWQHYNFADAGAASTLFIAYEATPSAGATATYTNCVAKCDSYAASLQPIGFYNHTSSGSWGGITYTGCSADNCGQGWSTANATSLTLTDFAITNFGTIVSSAGVSVSVLRGTASGAKTGATIGGMSGTIATLVFDGLDITWNTTGSFGFGCANTDITIRNCILRGANLDLRPQATGQTWHVHNNQFLHSAAGRQFINAAVAYAATTWDSDNNYFGAYAGQWVIGANTYNTLAEWRAASGQDLNSTGAT